MDLYIDEVTGDLDLSSNSPRFTISDMEEVRQKVEIRLRTLLGEWFANTNAGMPYFQTILQKGVKKEFIDATIRQKAYDTAGVINVTNFTSEINNQSRQYSAKFRVTTVEGTVDIEL